MGEMESYGNHMEKLVRGKLFTGAFYVGNGWEWGMG